MIFLKDWQTNDILTVEDVIKYHDDLIEATGGSKGIRDLNLLI
jgi:hypothetical protein